MSVRQAKLCDYPSFGGSEPCTKIAVGTCIACQYDTCADHVRARIVVAYTVIAASKGDITHLALNDTLKHEMVLCTKCTFRTLSDRDVKPHLIALGDELGTTLRAQLAAAALAKP